MDRIRISVLRCFSRLQVVANLGGGRAEGHTNRVSCLALAADGDALCTGSWDTTLKVCKLYITTSFLALTRLVARKWECKIAEIFYWNLSCFLCDFRCGLMLGKRPNSMNTKNSNCFGFPSKTFNVLSFVRLRSFMEHYEVYFMDALHLTYNVCKIWRWFLDQT